MTARVKKLAASLAVWTCLSSFPLWAQADSTSARFCYPQLRAVEMKLRTYLHRRVLVFRKGGVSRYQIKFDDRAIP
ncbi:MAG: hypothetical protein L0312_18195 [Acidobacteria bacterium]|nr:hypothetical protein [Acidobacteriota bacterium]MCI0718082.1 hypothetical protein [Acidobacteriota bacterium]